MSNKTVTPVARELMKARAAITPRERWCQGKAYDKATGAHCAISAMCWHIAPGLHYVCETAILQQLLIRGEPREIARFNDTHTHEEVLGLFDAAIEHEVKNVRDEAK